MLLDLFLSFKALERQRKCLGRERQRKCRENIPVYHQRPYPFFVSHTFSYIYFLNKKNAISGGTCEEATRDPGNEVGEEVGGDFYDGRPF